MTLAGLAVGGLAVAFVVTVIELTEVVALVFALGAEAGTVRHGALGAAAGVAVVAVAAVGAGAAVVRAPPAYLLGASAVVLAAFGLFLFRSTARTYRRARGLLPAPPPRSAVALRFAGGFAVGAVEATEVVVVLLALAAGGEAVAAIVGALAGGVVLVVVAAAVRERVRRIKTAWLKLGATSMVFAFAAYWAGEALGVRWPGEELALLPLFVAALLVVRGAIALGLSARGTAGPPPAPVASTERGD